MGSILSNKIFDARLLSLSKVLLETFRKQLVLHNSIDCVSIGVNTKKVFFRFDKYKVLLQTLSKKLVIHDSIDCVSIGNSPKKSFFD